MGDRFAGSRGRRGTLFLTQTIHRSGFFIEPKTTSQLEGLRLKNWYGPLAPGSYRLINRRRFEIDGPWTADSAELVFEVVRQ
jgi:hypothetical protein